MSNDSTQATAQQTSAGRLPVSETDPSTGTSRSAHASAQPVGETHTLQRGVEADGTVSSLVQRTVLPGGLRVITEQMVGVRSASIGIFVAVGSRHETPRLHGCSHFLEHLLFKGTPERTALEISVALDEVGGEFNAFTAKEYTCFHARVLDDDLPMTVDVLGDMLTASTITAEDVEAEREVILDEIAMHDDDPDDVVHNLFAAQAWGSDTPLGRSIAGTDASIRALTREEIDAFYREHYTAANMVVAVAGNVQHQQVLDLVGAAFARNDFLTGDRSPIGPIITEETAPVHPGTVSATKETEQVNVVLGVDGMTRSDERRWALGVLSTALGGGTSSRLFQEVREVRGLAYSVYSFGTHYADAGLVGVAVGCLPSKVEEVLSVVRAELAKVAEHGITADELRRGQGQLRGSLALGLEDSGSRMARIGKAELMHDEMLSIDDVMAKIDGVTLEQVQSLAGELFTQDEVLAVVGPARN